VSDSAAPTTCEAPPARPACADRHRPRGSTVVDLTRLVLQYSRPQPALTRSPGYAGQGVSILAHQAAKAPARGPRPVARPACGELILSRRTGNRALGFTSEVHLSCSR
jgi:hypothetical protein